MNAPGQAVMAIDAAKLKEKKKERKKKKPCNISQYECARAGDH